MQEALLAQGQYKRCLRWLAELRPSCSTERPVISSIKAAIQVVDTTLGGLDGNFVKEMTQLTQLLVGGGRTRQAQRYVALARALYEHPSLATAIDDARSAVRARRGAT